MSGAKEFTIGKFNFNETSRPYLIAEISGNHNGDLKRALELVRLAKEAGADAVKLQTYTADTMTLKSSAPDFTLDSGLWKGKTLYDLYEWAHTPWEWHEELFKEAQKNDIEIFSSPFDETAVDYLENLNVNAYKIASFEITDLPLVDYVASKKKPLIVSTGMANIEEILDCQKVIEKHHNNYVFLHCVSGYPAPVEDYNLSTLPLLQKDLDSYVGLSDHTLGLETALVSVAFGVKVIEKHFTFSRSEPGPDNAFSLEPKEFKSLSESLKVAHASIGVPSYNLKESESGYHQFRRSIYVSKDIKKGEEFTPENIQRVRPGFGLPCKEFKNVLGKKAKEDISFASPLSWDHIES